MAAEKPEDFKLPISVVQKIIKDALPDGVAVDKDARDAIARAASIFILYTTTCANTVSVSQKRKTLSAQDVLDSINNMAFDEFIADLIKWHDQHRRERSRKEKQKAKKVKESGSASSGPAGTSASASTSHHHEKGPQSQFVPPNEYYNYELIDLDNDDNFSDDD